jgi:hypothetical protein
MSHEFFADINWQDLVEKKVGWARMFFHLLTLSAFCALDIIMMRSGKVGEIIIFNITENLIFWYTVERYPLSGLWMKYSGYI